MKIKLFCFPYAGGSAAIYNSWHKHIGAAIELIPVELTGRGRRIADPLYRDMDEMIDELFDFVHAQLNTDAPYALFGHSMGAIAAYEIGRRTVHRGLNAPLHIFFSGRAAPDTDPREKQYHLMPEDQFRAELINLGGTPPEFFENEELMDLYLPMLKNDFKLAETAVWKSDGFQFASDITVFTGKQDELLAGKIEGWKRQTEGKCTIHYFEGGHFFLHQEYKEMIKLIRHELKDRNMDLISY